MIIEAVKTRGRTIMAFSFNKRFTAPMPGGDKTVRVFVPGVVVSLVIGVAGFVWLLVRHEWLAAFGGLVFGLASFATMAMALQPNMRMFEAVDRAVAEKDGRRLARMVWLESFFLHAAKAVSIFIAFVGPIFLLREKAANLLPAALFGLSLADPPHGFICDESGDTDWHATFRPFCQLVPIILFLGAAVWHLPLRSLVSPFVIATVGFAVLMARFNLRRYRARMAAQADATAKFQGADSPSAPASRFSPDDLARLAAIPGARLEVELKEVPRKKKRLPPGAFRAGGEIHTASSTPASRRHSSRRSNGRR